MKPADLHLQGIRGLCQPQKGEDLMTFLELTNYFAELLNHFVGIARPRYAVLRGTGFNKRKRTGKNSSYGIGARGGAMHKRKLGDTLRAH